MRGRDGRRYPPLDVICWDKKGVWFAEIFFWFSGRLWQCRLAKLLAYIVECVQIDREWNGNLLVIDTRVCVRGKIFCFVSVLNVSVFGGFYGVLAKNILPVLEIVVYLQRESVRMRV